MVVTGSGLERTVDILFANCVGPEHRVGRILVLLETTPRTTAHPNSKTHDDDPDCSATLDDTQSSA